MAGVGLRVPLAGKDAQLLWARATGLCSFPECKKNLSSFSRRGVAFHIGENAHMYAYSLQGPRGRGGMSPAARDSYSNCILLCPTCHTLVDKNIADYPVHVLRRFKVQHESWVAESLRAHSGRLGPSANFYRTLLRRIERFLHLGKWPWLIDNLWRDLLPTGVLYDEPEIAAIGVGTLWPRTRPQLEKAVRVALTAWAEYVEHFMSFSDLSRSGTFFVRDRPWAGASGLVAYQFDVKADAWSKKNHEHLQAYVASLNRLLEAVRSELDPAYRQDQGSFLVFADNWVGAPKDPVRRARARVARRVRSRPAAPDHGNRSAAP